MSAHMNRRSFLKASAVGGAALVLGFRLPEASAQNGGPAVINMARPAAPFAPNAYLRIDADGIVTITVHRSEMGQGVATALPMILADELEAEWASVRTVQAPPDRAYGDQVTGGSVSIQSSYKTLRNAGAAARMMLVAAAAQIWGVEAASCRAADGAVIHDATSQQMAYGDLVDIASTLEVPGRKEIVLKEAQDFRLIGRRMGNLNNAEMVTGSVAYASDMQLPGMLVAVVARCPVFGGQATGFDASQAEAVEGVRHVVQIRSGVAVVADNTWAALQGRAALQVTWDEGSAVKLNTPAMREVMFETLKVKNDPDLLEAVYEIPYLAHATMEPMTCVADVQADRCEIWAPSQDRQGAQRAACAITGLDPEAITVHVPLIGGAFGRRLQDDYVEEAAEISQAVGAPVKVFWTREDDIQHDFYHPFTLSYRSTPRDGSGRVSSNRAQGYGAPTGAWRSVDNFTDAVPNECFVDELAAATGQDPLEMRRALYGTTKLLPPLELAAEKAGWGTPLPDGWGRGIAVFSTFGVTPVAMVVEVSVEAGTLRVHRVVCAVDCGMVINPDGVEAQMEGGIAFGLSAALHGEITLQSGRVEQSNFHNYPVLRLDEMPTIEVYTVASADPPRGVGEMAVPPVVPALLNAIYAATGTRLRRLPVRAEDLR